MTANSKPYLPAAGHDLLLPFYDVLSRLLRAGKVHRQLLEQAAIQPGHRVLDIGCGTGAVTLLAKNSQPNAEVVGLDPDPKALARARRKAARAQLVIQFDQGFADEMPYPDASFDRVLSSLMFHHIPRKSKPTSLREVRRVLKPGGSFHMVDLVGPSPRKSNPVSRSGHSEDHMADTTADRVVALLGQAGFTEPVVFAEGKMFFWRVAYYRAT